MTLRFERYFIALLSAVLLFFAQNVQSQDALKGKALYVNANGAPKNCADADCHGPDPTRNKSNVLKGANNASAIQTAIASKVGEMKFLSAYVTNQNALDLAAYLANPSVSAAPAVSVAPTSVSFVSTYVGSASAVVVVSVSNTGTANLVLSNVVLQGTNASEFRLESTSTCRATLSLAPGATCRADLTFRPSSTGTKSANVAISHNATSGTTQVPLAGTAGLPPAPAISVSPAAISFPSTTGGSTSAVYSVTVSNTGTAALTFSAISTTGVNAGDFRVEPTSTCSTAASLAPGTSCRVDLTFRPTLVGTESASLVLAHNAAGGSSSVALNATATAAPTPTIGLSASVLSFGPQEVGTSAATKTITLTNVGSAVLNISALTPGGTHAADFPRSGTCTAAMALAPSGGNCTLVFGFAPTAVGTRSGNLTIASNNSGGNVTVSLTGSATTNVPSASVSPATLTFGTQQIGTSSTPQQVTVRNVGGGSLSIAAIAIAGSHFAQSGSCLGTSLSAGQTCTISVVFAPGATGSLASALAITHNAAGSPSSVALAGVSTATPVPVVQASPASVAFPGVTVIGQPSAVQRVTFSNAGPGSVTLSAISTGVGEFAVVGSNPGNCAAGTVIAQGASCTVDIIFSPATAGARTGALSVTSSGTPGILSVNLTGDATGVAAPGIASDRIALDFGAVAVDAQSNALPVELTSTGSTNLDVSAVSVGAPFSLASGGTCAGTAFILPPGQSCLLEVKFAPNASGSQSGMLSVASNAGSLSVTLAGEGTVAPTAGQNQTQTQTQTASAAGTPTNVGGGGAMKTDMILLLLFIAFAITRRGASASCRR